MNDNIIKIYTDGACSGNPGPAGCGVVIIYPGGQEKQFSKFIGENSTNNIAELTAILIPLQSIKNIKSYFKVIIYSDSQYSINVLTGKWKAKKNIELIIQIKKILAEINVEFVKVKAHDIDHYNNLADKLAVLSITHRESNISKNNISDYI